MAGSNWTVKVVEEFWRVLKGGNLNQVKAFMADHELYALPEVQHDKWGNSVCDGRFDYRELWGQLAVLHDVDIYRYFRSLGMPLGQDIDEKMRNLSDKDTSFSKLYEAYSSSVRYPKGVPEQDSVAIAAYFDTLLDDGWEPVVDDAFGVSYDPRMMEEFLLGMLSPTTGLMDRFVQAGFHLLTHSPSTDLFTWPLVMDNNRGKSASFLVERGDRPERGVLIGPKVSLEMVHTLVSLGIPIRYVHTSCSKGVLIACANDGAKPVLGGRGRSALVDDQSSSTVTGKLRDYESGDSAICASLDAQVIEAFLLHGAMEKPDYGPARVNGRQDILNLFARYGFEEEDATDRLVAMIEKRDWNRELDPNALAKEASSGTKADWRVVFKSMLDCYRQRDFQPHIVRDAVWLPAFKAVLGRIDGDVNLEYQLPIKEPVVKAKGLQVSNKNNIHPLSRYYWKKEDAQIYRLLISRGVRIVTDATPEAVFVHCEPGVGDLLFDLYGWRREDMRFTAGQANACILASQSLHAFEWLLENRPNLVDLSKYDLDKLQGPGRPSLDPKFKKAVEAAKLAGNKRGSRIPRKSLPVRIKEACQSLEKSDEKPLVELVPDVGKASKKVLNELMTCVSEHAGEESATAVIKAVKESNRSADIDLLALLWQAVSSGNVGAALAYAGCGTKLKTFGKSNFACEMLDKKHVGQQWRVIETLLDRNPAAVYDPASLAIYAVHYDRVKVASTLLDLPNPGWFSASDFYEEAQFERGGRYQTYEGLSSLIRPGISAGMARMLCARFSGEVTDRWDKRFCDGDPKVLAVLVPYLDGSRIKEKGSLLRALASAGDLKSIMAISKWDGTLTRANIKRAVDAAFAAGETETVSWLLDKQGELQGGSHSSGDLKL